MHRLRFDWFDVNRDGESGMRQVMVPLVCG